MQFPKKYRMAELAIFVSSKPCCTGCYAIVKLLGIYYVVQMNSLFWQVVKGLLSIACLWAKQRP